MNIVEACSKSEINLVTAMLEKRYSPIYADVWKIGLNLSLRVSDLLSIKYSDLDIRNRTLTMRESKTGKKKDIRLNDKVLAVIAKRRKLYPLDTWLFEVHSSRKSGSPITRGSVSRVFKEAGDWLGLTINTHSMRKSRGKAMHDDGVSIEKIAKVLNHTNIYDTMRYIGITKQDILQTYDDYQL